MKLQLILLLAPFIKLVYASNEDNPSALQIKWDNHTEVFEREVAKLITALYPYKDDIELRADSSTTSLTCELCSELLPIVKPLAEKVEKWLLNEIAVAVCEQLHLAPRDNICRPTIELNLEQVRYILLYPPAENEGSELCYIIAPDCMDKYPMLVKWDIEVRGDKPPKAGKSPVEISTTPSITFLQFTDIHLDLDYKMYAKTECGDGMPICCREEEGGPLEGGRAAGLFGDFKCGLPETAWAAMLKDSKERFPETKYIFFTGDYVHSGAWLYSEDENHRHIHRVINLTLETFPNTIVYPIAGNHEANVCNMFVPPALWNSSIPTFNMTWMYHSVMDQIIDRDPQLIPEEEIQRFLDWGYYTVKAEEGLRFIFLNTNYCFELNMWMGYNATDIGGQLKWLEGILAKAENDKEAVYLIGHVEPGDCVRPWNAQFNKIIVRYEGIIKAMFSGHDHYSHYRVHFENGTANIAEPVSILSGSALTDGGNPVYSAYYVDGVRDGRSWGLLRHKMIELKLTESNLERNAKFDVLLDSLEGFGMNEGINGESVFGLAKRIICDQELMDQYLRFHYKGKDTFAYKECSIEDKACKMSVLSAFTRSNRNDTKGWEELQNFISFTECTSGASGVAKAFVLMAAISVLTIFNLFSVNIKLSQIIVLEK